MRHIVDYKAPVVLHPILLKKYYPTSTTTPPDTSRSGAATTSGAAGPGARILEPWNQQRFDPSEPYIDRVQWRTAYKSFRANQDHFQHNIGA